MARCNSFYISPECWAEHVETVQLDGAEARHMLKVLRTRVGDTVRLFDGCGRSGFFTLEQAGKRDATLRLVESEFHAPPAGGLTIACGWNRSSRRGWLLEKSVELQAQGIIFWQADYSQGVVPAEPKEAWTEKLVQAAKQCGNPFLPQLQTISSGVAGLVEAADAFDNICLLWECAEKDALIQPEKHLAGSTLLVLGPEGGISKKEAVALVEAGFVSVSLGKSILRWETAALHALSLGFHAQQKALLEGNLCVNNQ